MSSGLIVLIFIVALILIVGYVVAVILKNEMKPYWQHWKNERKSYTTFRSTMK